MKKLITVALIATMAMTMSVTSFASFSKLGNFVTSTEELEVTGEDEEPVEEEDYETATETIPATPVKPNPSTGAGNLDILLATAGLLTVAGAVVMKKS